MVLDVEKLGQVFTPDHIVNDMISLIRNQGKILEPSAGDGAFVKKITHLDVTAIEFDENLAKKNDFINIDFFHLR